MPVLTPLSEASKTVAALTESSKTATALDEFTPTQGLFPSATTYPSAAGTFPATASGLVLTPLTEA